MGIILGVISYTKIKIKIQERPNVGLESELIAKLTKYGFAIVPSECKSKITYRFPKYHDVIRKIYLTWTD